MILTRIQTTAIKRGEWHHITPLSDLHIGSAACDETALTKLLAQRAKLTDHRIIVIGDLIDAVLPSDLKRHNQTTRKRAHAHRDDALTAQIDLACEILSGHTVDIVGAGNHEAQVLRRHHVDPTAIIAERIGARYGGYAGYVQYPAPSLPPLSILYHHGAWGGRVAKGMPGLRDWARHYEGWDIAMVGHNHALLHDVESRVSAGSVTTHSRDVHYLVCGTHTGRSDVGPGVAAHYATMRGFAPTTIGAPLIRWRHERTRGVRGKMDLWVVKIEITI